MRKEDSCGVALVLPMRLGNAEPPMSPLVVLCKVYPKTGGYILYSMGAQARTDILPYTRNVVTFLKQTAIAHDKNSDITQTTIAQPNSPSHYGTAAPHPAPQILPLSVIGQPFPVPYRPDKVLESRKKEKVLSYNGNFDCLGK